MRYSHGTISFNEAAGIPRGRRRRRLRALSGPARFNEAAGIPRGRHSGAEGFRAVHEFASMRPRVFPAEDLT